jgi:hypothetical protein
MQKLGHHMKIGLGMGIDVGKPNLYFNQQDALNELKNIYNKTLCTLGTKSYMFRHQGVILRGFIKKKECKSNMYLGASRTCPS